MKNINEFYVFLTGLILCLKKAFLLLHTVVLNYVIYGILDSRQELNQSDCYSFDQRSCLSFKLFTTDPQEKPYLPN